MSKVVRGRFDWVEKARALFTSPYRKILSENVFSIEGYLKDKETGYNLILTETSKYCHVSMKKLRELRLKCIGFNGEVI